MENPLAPANKNIIQMVITYDTDTSAVQVAGPIGNKILCYGLLSAAEDAIREFVEKNKIGVMPDLLRTNLKKDLTIS